MSSFEIKHRIAAVETTGYQNCALFDMNLLMPNGTDKAKRLVERYDFHVKNNIWDKSMEEIQGNGLIQLIPKE